MASEPVWLTVKEKKWKVGYFGKFHWTGKEELWDSDNCTVNIARSSSNNCLIIVRSSQTKLSSFMGKEVLLRYMLSFEVSTKISELRTELYVARKNFPHRSEGPKSRWAFQLDDKHWIWEWVQPGVDITKSAVYSIHQAILNEFNHPSRSTSNILDADLNWQFDKIVPVIYQPSVDALKNFLREVHCSKGVVKEDGSYEIEVSLLFDNEVLRQNGILNSFYSLLRKLLHRRVMDLESFKIHVEKDFDAKEFSFEGIYSHDFELNEDSTHGDKVPPPAPKRAIKYYLMDHKHPIVFVNTSNHAMAGHDTNSRLWKWEYIPWIEDAPVKLKSKSRREIEAELRSLVKFW